MKVVADNKIPGLSNLLSSEFDLELLPLEAINSETLKNADAFIGRSVLKVNKELLDNTKVQVVATCTSGTDHIDMNYLKEREIALFSAPGSNAQGVADYVLWMLAYCEKNHINVGANNIRPHKKAGIIGGGYVGTKVQSVLEILGFEVIVNDPPKALKDSTFISASLEEIADCDLICVHPFLTKTPPYPSYHLLAEDWWKLVKENTVFINAARGAVVDTNALLKQKKNIYLCLDVFEDEPNVNKKLIKQCVVATPHIAGHTIESFYRATEMIVDKIHHHFGVKNIKSSFSNDYSQEKAASVDASYCCSWYDVILKCYNFCAKLELTPTTFYTLRNTYRDRHDFSALLIKTNEFLSDADRFLLEKLQLNVEKYNGK
jgi:erythronate-4-phosphate dehydrogenase